MEDTPLYKAHQENRRALCWCKMKRYDECIDSHREAIKYLHLAKSDSNHPHAWESLEVQIENHERQIRLMQCKKQQYNNHREGKNAPTMSFEHLSQGGVDRSLQAVYDTLNQHDSFICYLNQRGQGSDNDSCSMSDPEERIVKVTPINGFKHPKDDSTIIEEFKELCNSYRESIRGLLIQLDDKNMEVWELKTMVQKLEDDKYKAQKSQTAHRLNVITDSSGGTSPYVYSPASEPSELSTQLQEIGELLQLAPLESPPFDFHGMPSSSTE